MDISELDDLNEILLRFGITLSTVIWVIRICKFPNSTVSELATSKLDAANIRVGLRNRGLGNFIKKGKLKKQEKSGRPAATLSLNKRGLKLIEVLETIL